MTEPLQSLPARFGPFYLYDLIGRGGMAEIFLAKSFTSLGVGRQLVIKRILPHLNEDQDFGEMLIDEAKLCARLSHANVVQTFDLGKIDGRYYISMEYVEGFDLNRLLGLLSRSRIALPLPFAIYTISAALKGLDYAHRLADASGAPLGIIHRDVSPTNVLISTEGEVKLCDFGIAKVAMGSGGSQRIEDYHLKGKFAYMAPEHVRGEEIDHRADLFAAGILLWEMLSGRRLYKTKDEEETLRRAREAEIPPLTDRGFPRFETLEAIVRKALAVDPDERFQTGQEFVRALENYLHDAQMIVSQLRFSEFLMEHFGEDLLEQRRERECNLAAVIDEEPPSLAPPEVPVDQAAEQRASAILASFEFGEESGLLELPGLPERPEPPAAAVPPERPSYLPTDSVRFGEQSGRTGGPPVMGLLLAGAAIAAAVVAYLVLSS